MYAVDMYERVFQLHMKMKFFCCAAARTSSSSFSTPADGALSSKVFARSSARSRCQKCTQPCGRSKRSTCSSPSPPPPATIVRSVACLLLSVLADGLTPTSTCPSVWARGSRQTMMRRQGSGLGTCQRSFRCRRPRCRAKCCTTRLFPRCWCLTSASWLMPSLARALPAVSNPSPSSSSQTVPGVDPIGVFFDDHIRSVDDFYRQHQIVGNVSQWLGLVECLSLGDYIYPSVIGRAASDDILKEPEIDYAAKQIVIPPSGWKCLSDEQTGYYTHVRRHLGSNAAEPMIRRVVGIRPLYSSPGLPPSVLPRPRGMWHAYACLRSALRLLARGFQGAWVL